MENKQKALIAIYISNYTIGNSPSLLNLICLLSKHYNIHLFIKNVGLISSEIQNNKNIKIIRIDGRINAHIIISIFLNRIKFKRIKYDFHVAVDPHGFVLCKELFSDTKPFYYSLELYLKNDHFGLDYDELTEKKERENISSIKGLIIQSEEKEGYFRVDYALSKNIPTYILPVTCHGPGSNEKSNYLRDLYKISKDNKIALHLGGIAEWFSCIEICDEFSKLDDWILIFHGYSNKEYIKKLNRFIKKKDIKNVIINEITYDSINELDKIVQSSDIGIAWYNDISIGFRTVGRSSGKIATYLKFGLPVISTRYASTVDAIENTNCGICISDLRSMENAVEYICKNYQLLSQNAISEYEKSYRFEQYEKK
ncbi:MAG: hypothetical protein APR54_08410, partial [Candidatus Cloacimonas sp. SDB]